MSATTPSTTKKITWTSGPSNAPLPPMARGLPLVGSVLDLADDVLAFMVKQYQTLGPIFRLKVLNDTYTAIAGPEANLFFAREGNDHFRSKEFWEGMDEELGAKTTLISTDGEEHARLRQLEKAGYGKSVVEAHFPEVVALTQQALAGWAVGESRPVLRSIQDLVTEQLGTITVGHGPGDYVADIRTFVRTALLVRVTKQRPGFLLHLPAYRQAKARSHELAQKIIERHRLNPPIDRAPNLVDDALAAVARGEILVDEDLVPVALGPYIAGLDTASNTIAFALYALYTHPEVLERVQAEADALFADGMPTPDRLRKVDVLHRALLETMRRYPIAPAVQRTVVKPFEFAGYRVEAGQRIFIGTTVAHFIPDCIPIPIASRSIAIWRRATNIACRARLRRSAWARTRAWGPGWPKHRSC